MPRPRASLACWALVLAAVLHAGMARAQDDFKVEPTKEPAPAALAAPIRATLATEGFRILDSKGKVYAEIWLRKGTPASEKPAGSKGTVLFPFLAEGELLGAMRFPDEGHDNRDQAIAKGVYTVRYGLQPVNGDHLGVSPYRDYALLLPAAKDTELAVVARKPLEERSAESAGTSHPAIFLLSAPAGPTLSVHHDTEKDTWSAVLPLGVEAKGAGASVVNMQLTFLGVVGG